MLFEYEASIGAVVLVISARSSSGIATVPVSEVASGVVGGGLPSAAYRPTAGTRKKRSGRLCYFVVYSVK